MNTTTPVLNEAVITIGTKSYFFSPGRDSIHINGFDGMVYPYLGTFIFTDKDLNLLAVIMTHRDKKPEFMNADWNQITKMPSFNPVFSRWTELGVETSTVGSELALSVFNVCFKAYEVWSTAFAASQMSYNPDNKTVCLFGKTFFISNNQEIPEGTDGVVYYDRIEGFIFIDQHRQPYLSLTRYANEQYFSSAVKLHGLVTSLFALNDADLVKLGGGKLLDAHLSEMAKSLFLRLSDLLVGVPA